MVEQDLTQFAVLIHCDDPTGCDKMGDYFAIDADTMIDMVCEVDLNEDKLNIYIWSERLLQHVICLI